MPTGFQTHPETRVALSHVLRLLDEKSPDQFEIYLENKHLLKIDSKDCKLESFTTAEESGLAVRLIRGKRLGFSYTSSLELSSLEKAVEHAWTVSQFMPEDPCLQFYSFKNGSYADMNQKDLSGIALPFQEKWEIAKRLEASCLKVDPKITAVSKATLSEERLQVLMADSYGNQLSHEKTLFGASVQCKAEHLGDQQLGYDHGFSHWIQDLPLDSVAQGSANSAVEKLNAKALSSRKCPAILKNSLMAELLDFLAPSFSAEQIAKKRSALTLGQTVFSPKISILNNGLLPDGYGSSPFDAEGVPSQKITLVKQGVFSQKLYDTYYARKEKQNPSGSSVRGVQSLPSIGYSNLYIQNGNESFDGLIRGISSGVLITDLLGLHTANPVTADFSVGASGLLIENGRCSHAIQGFAISGNLIDLLKNVVAIGSDLRFFGKIGAPSVVISELSVSGA